MLTNEFKSLFIFFWISLISVLVYFGTKNNYRLMIIVQTVCFIGGILETGDFPFKKYMIPILGMSSILVIFVQFWI